MAFFKKDNDEPAAEAVRTTSGGARSTSASPKTTRVATGTVVEGSVSGKTEVLVEGALIGRVDLEGRFVIGRQGRVQGDVAARSVQVAGKVKGNVRATEKVEVTPSGAIEGDLVAPLVSIAEGGVCNGSIEMSGTLSIAAPPAAAAPAVRRPASPRGETAKSSDA